MSDATLKILFEDNGDNIPAQPPSPIAPSSAKKPHETVNGNASDTNPNGIESPYERTGPAMTERIQSPWRDDAKKGMDEFFDVLKDSGERVAEATGVGRIYATIAELLASVYAVVSAFQTKAEKSADETSTPGPREAVQSVSNDTDTARAEFDEDKFIAEQNTKYKIPDLAKIPDLDEKEDTPRAPDTTDYSFIERMRKEKPISDDLVGMEKMAEPIATAEAVEPGLAAPGIDLAGVLASLKSAALPAAAALGVVTAEALALRMAFSAISSQVDQLQEYSPAVGVAAAQSELRQEFATMRRADRLGPDLASFENARGKIDEKLADLQTELLRTVLKMYGAIEPLMPTIERLIVIATKGVEGIADLATYANTGNQATKAAFAQFFPKLDLLLKAFNLAGISLDDILKAFDKDDDDDAIDPWLEQLAVLAAPGMPRHPGGVLKARDMGGAGVITHKKSFNHGRRPGESGRGTPGAPGMGGGV